MQVDVKIASTLYSNTRWTKDIVSWPNTPSITLSRALATFSPLISQFSTKVPTATQVPSFANSTWPRSSCRSRRKNRTITLRSSWPRWNAQELWVRSLILKTRRERTTWSFWRKTKILWAIWLTRRQRRCSGHSDRSNCSACISLTARCTTNILCLCVRASR